MVEFLHLRQSTSPRHRWTPRRKIANHNSYHESTSPSLQTLARKGKFDLLLEELQGMDKERFMIIMQQQQQQQPGHVVGRKKSKKNANKQDASSSCSLLHAVLAHRPPLHVVELLLQRTSECCTNIAVPEEIKDAHGRTPLHVAVASGCDVQVIDRLLSGVSLVVPALTKDVYERFPLHYAVCCNMPLHKTNQRKRKGSNSSSSDNDRQRETVYLLLNTYPVAVVIPDVYGKTPLEYARENRHCLKDASHIVDALESVAKHHASYKVKKPVAAAAPPVPPSSKRLKRRNYLFSSSSKGTSSPAVAPPTAEMTERESVDGDNDDALLLVPLRGLSPSSTTRSPSKRRVVRLEQNAQQDDMSTLGFDVASSSGPASVVHRQRRKSSSQRMSTRPARPMVRAKNLTMSLTPAAAAAAATTTDRPMVRAKTLTLSSSSPAKVAAATTSLMIAPASSNVQCRCKTLLRGRLKKKRSSASKKKKKKKPEPVIEEEEDQEEETTQQEAQDSDQEEMDEPPATTTEGARNSSSWLWIF